MLTKRTQILMDEKLWNHLNKTARESNTSVGALFRLAAEEKYLSGQKTLKLRKAAIEATLKRRKVFKDITYKEIKEMINYGRKY